MIRMIIAKGFPPHPHRGFETITYMINGKFRHKDSAGNEGYLKDGSVQWMTAGKELFIVKCLSKLKE